MTVEQMPGAAGILGAGSSNATENTRIFPSGADGVPPMTFNVPDNFLAYPVDADPAARMAAADAFVRELYGRGDGSWVRLDFGGPVRAYRVARVLSGNLEPVVLTEAQQARIAGFLGSHRKSYAETVADAVPASVPGVPPGIVAFDMVRRCDNGDQYRTGALMLRPDGEVYLIAERQKK